MGIYKIPLKLSTFSDIWKIDKTPNKFIAHELKMRCKLLNFARKLFLMLLKKIPPPALENLSLRNIFVYSTL
jgi:hypothetical protein